MGDSSMRFFRTSPELYAQTQLAVDEAFRTDYIDAGRCDHVLPVELPAQSDGKCYIALPDWMTDHPLAASFISTVEEVSEEVYSLKINS